MPQNLELELDAEYRLAKINTTARIVLPEPAAVSVAFGGGALEDSGEADIHVPRPRLCCTRGKKIFTNCSQNR